MLEIRLHSSGMCTARLLTVSQHALCRVGVFPGRSASGHWGFGVVCIPACNGEDTPPVDRQTQVCENITFANFVCGR